MLKKTIQSLGKFKTYTFRNRATFFGQPQDFDSSKDYYLTLGVSKDANSSDIKKSYYRLAKQNHPDLTKGKDTKFKQISQAYEVLSDEKRRKAYDQSRTFGNFSRSFRGRAQQGSYNYQDYTNIYQNRSAEQKEQIRVRIRANFKKFALYTLGFFTFWFLFTRRPHNLYTEINGQLIPVPDQLANDMMRSQSAPMGGPGSAYGSPYNYNPSLAHPPTYSQNFYDSPQDRHNYPPTYQSNYQPAYQPQAQNQTSYHSTYQQPTYQKTYPQSNSNYNIKP